MFALVLAAVVSITPPDNFNPDLHMLTRMRGGKPMHQSRAAARFARELVANGSPEDIVLAVKVLDGVITCQERREGNRHQGNFRQYLEDESVTGPNVAGFILGFMIPMMIEHGDRLPEASRTSVREAIRLAVNYIERRNVRVSYTNAAVMDLAHIILGGELLGDAKLEQLGRGKLAEWMAFTDENGIPAEYNSPTYYRVTIRALRGLIRLVEDRDTKIRAKTALARLGLTQALHIHPGTKRMSGPHSRAYHRTVVGEDRPEIESIRGWIDDGTFPPWLRDALDHQSPILDILETPLKSRDLTITTRHTPTYALGVASTGYGGQSNVLISHYLRPGQDRHGVVYTRYLTNEKWLGSFYHEASRSTANNLIDEGRFFGVQQGSRAIGLYTPREPRRRRAPEGVTSAKGNVIWTGRAMIDEIWIGQSEVDSLPADVPPGNVVVVVSGSVMTAIRPLTRTALSDNAPLRLSDKEGDLVLEIYNYLGEEIDPRTFDDLNGSKPQCGFYLEIVDRSAYADGAVFAKVVASGGLKDETGAPDEEERAWTVEYTREGETLGIEVDLVEWKLKRRWTQKGESGFPMLESRIARQNRDGLVKVGEAVLTCGKEAAWLFAPPETGRYVAAYHGQVPAPLTLTVPGGRVDVEAMAVGTVVWDNGRVSVEAVGLEGTPKIEGGRLIALQVAP